MKKKENMWSITILWWIISTINLFMNPKWYLGCSCLILGISMTAKSFKEDFRQCRSQSEFYIVGTIISIFFAIIMTIFTISLIVENVVR